MSVPPCTGLFADWLGLRYEPDKRTLLWVAIYHVLTVALWKVWWDIGIAAKVVGVVVCAYWSFLGATITHNAIHVPLFDNKYGNSLFQVVLSHTYGWPVSALVPGHNLSHHKFTNTAKDAMRPQRMQFKWNLLNYLLFPAVTAYTIAASDKAYMMDQKEKNRPIWRQYLVEAVSFYSVQALLVVYCPEKWFFVVFLPQLYAKYQIIAMNILQHDGCPAAEDDPINNSRNFIGATINYMTFNNGYHTIHHTNPGWHWYRLPSAHAELIAPSIHPNLDQKNILGYFFKAHVYPGKRTMYDGAPYVTPPVEDDEPWYSGTAETYSDVKKEE
eukprot:TRINITY_DN46509_c0_g1_i1.p1 TRINITY_DN46509_c0_g1~~TRINITY_DN46509_c0_g1_i1.p1  ORF type:complete len:340 (+),score=54.68 TRINITY_DN46509_c0_g1_i1:38-1021(+)